jgi:hypothetical protein
MLTQYLLTKLKEQKIPTYLFLKEKEDLPQIVLEIEKSEIFHNLKRIDFSLKGWSDKPNLFDVISLLEKSQHFLERIPHHFNSKILVFKANKKEKTLSSDGKPLCLCQHFSCCIKGE